MRVLLLLLCLGLAPAARAEGEPPGIFDHWILALSWSPGWCAAEGAARGSPQCDSDRRLGWILHGLWPQYETGWPSECPTGAAPPSAALAREMSAIMGTTGLVHHEWRRHGTCSGLSARAYFDRSRAAYDSIARPRALRSGDRPDRLPARAIEDAFLEANPGLEPDMITITCKAARIREARICLHRETLRPIPCGPDTRRDCRLEDALLDPIP